MNSKRSTPVKRILLILVGLAVVGSLVWHWYSSTHPLSNSKYGFQFYQPTRLPDGIHIMQKRITINKPSGVFTGIQAEMNFRTVDWIYSIQESRINTSASPDSGTVTTKLRNYNPKSADWTCRQQVSPKGQTYRLCHSVDYGKIGVFAINFIKSQTYISTKFPTTIDTVFSTSQFDAYVDSFTKAKAAGFKIESGGI